MLNLFPTDRAAVSTLAAEYERYFALCRPLMRIFTGADTVNFQNGAEGNACLSCAPPPLFAMPETVITDLSSCSGSDALLLLWKRSLATFRKKIKSSAFR